MPGMSVAVLPLHDMGQSVPADGKGGRRVQAAPSSSTLTLTSIPRKLDRVPV